jgi:uncharacterized protein YcbK (DUF882 family)
MSEHFTAKEMACNCCGKGGVSKKLTALLEEIRAKLGAPITVLSGYRCADHNLACGGVKNSQHLLGTAADIRTDKMKPHEFHAWIEEHFNPRGLGKYNTFTHIDVRAGGRARWEG